MAVAAPEMRKVSDEQHRGGQEQIGEPPQCRPDGLVRLTLRQQDERHDGTAQILEPALEEDHGLVGPSDTGETEQEVEADQLVLSEQPLPLDVPLRQHDHAPHDQAEEHGAVDGAPLGIRVNRRQRSAQVQPRRHPSRTGEEHPDQRHPRYRLHVRALEILPEQMRHEREADGGGDQRHHIRRTPRGRSNPRSSIVVGRVP
jgi:hypothetical protein